MTYYKKWRGYTLIGEDPAVFPADAAETTKPGADDETSKALYLVNRDPKNSRGVYVVEDPAEIWKETRVENLITGDKTGGKLYRVVNTAFPGALEYVCNYDAFVGNSHRYIITLVGLGDVGGTVLTALKLLGTEVETVRIFDPNEAACKRYEIELNQVLTPVDGQSLPRIEICKEEQLFDCDLFLFTASRGVPGLGTDVKDVRMAQFEANKKMLDVYAKMARDGKYKGMFCQISDPVDHLSREVFLASNRDEEGNYDWQGLLPEQVQGFGLGVMAARAAYYAKDGEKPVVYGPHGKGLIVANAPGAGYEEERSLELTKLTVEANLRVRDLGYKPYIAPGLSSAAISVLRLLRRLSHNGAVPLDGVYFGCRSRFTEQGLLYEKEEISPQLLERIRSSHKMLKEFSYE